MIPASLIAVLGLVVLAWVALPLRRGPQIDAPLPSLKLEEANAKKRAALVAILDLETSRRPASSPTEILRFFARSTRHRPWPLSVKPTLCETQPSMMTSSKKKSPPSGNG